MNVVPDPEFFAPDPSELASEKSKHKKTWTLQPLRQAWANFISRKVKSQPADAVGEFLNDMKKIADQVFPDWQQTMHDHIEATDLDFLAKRKLFEDHDLFMYFYCGLVAIEGIKVRALFDYAVASELESEINDQIDGVLGRTGRDAADLVFDMFRTVKRAEVEDLVKPHDQVMKWISRLLELDIMPETKDLLTDFMFCQESAAPFAQAHVHWWLTYKETYRLVMPKAD